MAKIYYKWLKQGRLTSIEQVPELFREKTQALLDADNKTEEAV